jgi:hypothetical protein
VREETFTLAALPAASHRESDDGYRAVVAHLNERWRVIVCRDGMQWVLQYRASTKTARRVEWKGRSYCRTRECLLRDVRYHAGEIDAHAFAIVEALPRMIGIGGAI